MIGQTLVNRYKITARLGKGAMGTVYRATDTHSERDVALKIISSELAVDPEMLERFKREGEALSKLKHPNIVGFLGTFEHGEQHVIVMDYVPGGSLMDLLRAGPLPIERARQITLDLCDALIRAHRLNIIHRDLKPENILIDQDGTPSLADFGVARLTEGTRMTRTGTKVGTPYYMAPEAWKGETIDAQADIWSLGVILFEMLSGQVPFDGDSEFTIMTKICTTPPPDLKKLRSDVPVGLVNIVRRMLTREKDRRYQTMRQVAVDLESGEQAIVPKTSTSPNFTLPKFRVLSGRIGLFVLLGAVVFGGLYVIANQQWTIAPVTTPEEQPPSTESVSADFSATTEVAASCEPAGTEPIPFPAGGKSATGALDEPDVIVPFFSQGGDAVSIAQLTLVGLAEFDDQDQLFPELAAEIPSVENGGISVDGLTITWKLKECLFWSDGAPLTSADVKYTWEAIMDPNNATVSRDGYDLIESIETPDDLTVAINFSEIYALWQTLFTQGTFSSGAILPKHILEGQAALEGNDFIRQPTVGSGPFIVTDWVSEDTMTLLPNPNFHAGRARLDRVQIRFISDFDAAFTALRDGEIDWDPNFSNFNIAALRDLEPAVQLTLVPRGIDHYFFNLGSIDGVAGRGISAQNGFCPFRDLRVRKAITLGINREKLVNDLVPEFGFVPASMWVNNYWTNTDLVAEGYDPNTAAALLEEAGYLLGSDGIRTGNCNGTQTRLSFDFATTESQVRIDAALAVQADLAQIGVEFNPIHSPSGDLFASFTDGGILSSGNYDMGGFAWLGLDNDASILHCDSIPNAETPDEVNMYHNCDPVLSDLIDSVRQTADPIRQKETIDEIQVYIAEKYYVIPMFARGDIIGSSQRFQFVSPGTFSDMFWKAETWDVN